MSSNQENFVTELISVKKKEIILEDLKGYETIKEFLIIPIEGGIPIIWLEAVAFDNLAFVTFDPYMLNGDYKPDFFEEDLSNLHINADMKNMFLLCLADLRHGLAKQGVTVNLSAPLVINWEKGIGRQVNLKNAADWKAEFYINKEDIF